jgi:CheY-like chemotaxis protein
MMPPLQNTRLRIAVVDDNNDSRFIFRTFLEDRYDVIEFADGQQAISGMKQSPPDIVFLDISLPGIDGLEILRRIRADETLRRLRVIAFTAHSMLGDRERFLNVGFDGYLSKPINLNLILELIEGTSRRPAAGASA